MIPARIEVKEHEWKQAAYEEYTCFCCGKHHKSVEAPPVSLIIRDNVRYPVDFATEYFPKGYLEIFVCPECAERLAKTIHKAPWVGNNYSMRLEAWLGENPRHSFNVYECRFCHREYWGHHRDNGFEHCCNSNHIRYTAKDPECRGEIFLCTDCMKLFITELEEIQKEHHYTPYPEE